MFENVGDKLQSIAIISFPIEMIVIFITAISVGVSSYNLGFLWFLLILVGGGLAAYLSALMMYALGEATENSVIILQKMKQSAEKRQESEHSARKATATTNYTASTKKKPVDLSKVEPVVRQQSSIIVKPASSTDFSIGKTVTHKKYGIGKVICYTKEGVTVQFENEERKTFKNATAMKELEIIQE